MLLIFYIKHLYNYVFLYTITVLILMVCNVIILTNIARIVSGGSYNKSQLNKYCNGLQWLQNSVLVIILNNTVTIYYKTVFFKYYYGRNNSLINEPFNQWRSEGGQGGGHLPPGAARRGAPKSCQGFFKNLYKENFFKF